MADVQSSIDAVHSYQATLSALTALALTDYHFPIDTPTSNLLSAYDHIVIGGGSAGCVVASRLSENANKTVLLLEAGGKPPLESVLPGLMSLLPNSGSDWNQTTLDDGHSTQNLVDNIAQMTKGKILGGSSGVDHMMYVRGNKRDFSVWENITGDDSWSYENMLHYFKIYENVIDEDILAEYSSYHGDSGPLKLSRQRNILNQPILDAFKEQGHKVLKDINANETVGYCEPLFNIADGLRYSSSLAYMSKTLNRTNLDVKYYTLVTKILFDSNNTAIGVEILDSDNVTSTITANGEIILSAGAVNTPVVLLNSGIGNKEKLNNLGLDIVAELPVGENLVDHCGAVVVYPLGKTTTETVTNYHEFPMPVTVGSVGLNSSEYPDYQTVNLLFEQNSSKFLQICSWIFKYKENICQQIYNVNKDHKLLVSVIYILHPWSRGEVTVNSTDPRTAATVNLGLLSDDRDINVLAQSVMDYNSIINTTYFQSLNSTMIELNLTKCNDLDKTTLEYFKCYVLEMSSTMWHYCSSCSMGTVLNSDLTVKNTTNLRVVDASAMPYTISGKILGGLYALAEKACDLIIDAYN